MKRTLLFLLLILFTAGLIAQPIPARLTHTVIIDTDCGMDDMRAISLILSRPGITVRAIITSDGSLPPDEGAAKVASLLHEFDMESIPVAAGDLIDGVNPPWRPFNETVSWGGKSSVRIESDGPVFLAKTIKNENEKTELICLGPLTNIVKAIENDASLPPKISRVIWYNESIKPFSGFNYECDKVSAEALFKSNIRIDVISNLGKENILFDIPMFNTCRQSNTLLAKAFNNVYSQPQVTVKLNENHFSLCDDLVALYLTNPELFVINANTDKLSVRFNKDYDAAGVKEAMCDMIKGIYVTEHNIVFNRFPAQREMFNYDIRPIMDSAIARYGNEEWKANVMTDEFHGHLGVFSIVGAKMGIKARELFGVGPDMLEVITYAGSKPPYSCLNDGIQVSTGATFGMGLIRLAKTKKMSPSAVFSYNGRSIKISLKKEYLDKVDADINEGISKFGLMDDGYWKLIRQNALKYWLQWDRNKIFDIQEISRKK